MHPVPTKNSVPVVIVAVRAAAETVRRSMTALLVALLAAFRSSVPSRLELETEILALRHQLAVLQRQAPKRPRLGRVDRLLWVLLSRLWPNWRRAVQIVTPDTVMRWHRRGFARYWRWRSRPQQMGRPTVAVAIRGLIRQMHAANPLWGAPPIHGELLKLGLTVSQTTVAKYLGRRDGQDSVPDPRKELERSALLERGVRASESGCFETSPSRRGAAGRSARSHARRPGRLRWSRR